MEPFLAASTLVSHREAWETIERRMKNGEMPPANTPQPSRAAMENVLKVINGEFARADRLVKPDPGRITARRLNRAEYTNTVRDLLGVTFRAEDEFPVDDSGYGFDTIGDVLSISPALMEKYFAAAEKIASKAIGGDPLPRPALYEQKRQGFERGSNRANGIEFTQNLDFDGDYDIRVWITGSRGDDSKPAPVNIWVDGKLAHTVTIDTRTTKITKIANMAQRSSEEFRIHLPEGAHTIRALLTPDASAPPPAQPPTGGQRLFMVAEMIDIRGPFPSKIERPTRKQILTCDASTGVACVEKIVAPLARRAYRRPVTKDEIAKLVKVWQKATQTGYTADQGIQFAIQAILVSPQFLYRVERNNTAAVSDLELASRLSYFLWSSTPDEELLRAAEAGKLRGSLDAQIKRMLADPKSEALSFNFAGQWLETRNLDAVKPDPKKFPEWGPELKEAMKTETRLFFANAVKDNRPVSDFLDARYTFLNERLAKHYGIDGVQGPEFRRVDLKTPERGGILTHASVLTVSSYPTRTSPVLRGKYVLENILGTPPPPPPADVPPLDEEAVGSKGSQRQQLELHRSNAVCASCHARMDVLGFGLENYDATGKWRTKDGNFPLDVSGVFPGGKSFDTPTEMMAILRADLPEFSRCLTEKLLTYSLGRGLERYDRRTVEEINRKVAASGYRLQSLIAEIVRSLPFQARRVESNKEVAAK
ncbi:MAG: DUF1592 domain-containing protein [Candidatus Solibacter usitatus]|nr:DUF1592 domain-containing protein [Candidatus Solibacter usitatus]